VYSQESDLFGIPVRVSLPYLRSIALGGGSVVRRAGEEIELGPESMGSFPGPVCYALGGEKPTLTDAFVTAGLIDPEYFLGGTKHLDLEMAREAIDTQVARPGRVSIQEACCAIVDRAYDMVAGMIVRAGKELGFDLREQVLFAYGGNGGLFACGVAERAEIGTVYLFGLGPVFSAFGSSVSDISHVYEQSFRLPLRDGKDVAPLNRLIEEMRAAGMRDLLGEGIKPDGAECSLELELAEAGKLRMASCSHLHFADPGDLRRRLGVSGEDACVELVRVRLKKAIARPAISRAGAVDALGAMTGTRNVAYGAENGKANLYRWETLQPGQQVRGCAILEAQNSTYFVPEGWALQMDAYGNACVKRDARAMPRPAASLEESRSHGKH
jgi:N-methylhydantoinase A/oxoprolinase/acetone carboxylase beta subunit